MLLFDNEEEARKFSAVELKRSSLSPSATSMVNQRAQSFHRTPAGQISGTSLFRKLQTNVMSMESQPIYTKLEPATTTTSKCPVGETYDKIEQMCVPSPSQAESGLTPGLQPFIPKIYEGALVSSLVQKDALEPATTLPVFPSAQKETDLLIPAMVATSAGQAPAPAVPNTMVPQSFVSQGLVQKGASPLLLPPRSGASTAAEPAQGSFVYFDPNQQQEGILDKSIVGGFKVKHALIGTGILGVLGAGIFALRTRS